MKTINNRVLTQAPWHIDGSCLHDFRFPASIFRCLSSASTTFPYRDSPIITNREKDLHSFCCNYFRFFSFSRCIKQSDHNIAWSCIKRTRTHLYLRLSGKLWKLHTLFHSIAVNRYIWSSMFNFYVYLIWCIMTCALTQF